MKTWLQAAVIFISLCVLMALMDDYDDRQLSEQVKRETIAQQRNEQLHRQAVNNKYRLLAGRAEYMTGFSMMIR